MSSRIIRIADIATTPTKTGILPVSPATIWRWVRDDKFPKPFKLGASVTGWYADDIEAFIAQRAAEAA
jgi:prophage regulatory protein